MSLNFFRTTGLCLYILVRVIHFRIISQHPYDTKLVYLTSPRNAFLLADSVVFFFLFSRSGDSPLLISRELLGVSVWTQTFKILCSTTILFWTIGLAILC